MFGYASRETKALMPMPIQVAHQLARQLAEVRKAGVMPYLGPDGKTQVTVRYENDRPVEIAKVLISTQHREEAGEQMIRNDLWEHVLEPVLHTEYKELFTEKELLENFMVNPTGKFVIGGPVGDAGLTGRKIIVDTYGGAARHGGGAFSGKDPSKVDRSAAYAARYVAKNVVAAGLADRCEVQVAYAIGVAHPGLGDGADLRHRQALGLRDRPAGAGELRSAAGGVPASTSTCTGRSSRRPRPTATSAARTRTSPGSGPTARTSCARPRGSGRRRSAGLGSAGSASPWRPLRQRGGVLDLLHHLLGLGHAREDEVRLVGAGGGELDVADLHDPLVDALAVVHVLHPLQPRLLDLPGDDPDLDVEPAVGDRVDGRDPLDEADEDRDGDDHDEGDDPESGAVVDQPGEDPGRGRHEGPLQVEADDRPPGRMPLVDHLLPGLQVHGGTLSPCASGSPVRART